MYRTKVFNIPIQSEPSLPAIVRNIAGRAIDPWFLQYGPNLIYSRRRNRDGIGTTKYNGIGSAQTRCELGSWVGTRSKVDTSKKNSIVTSVCLHRKKKVRKVLRHYNTPHSVASKCFFLLKSAVHMYEALSYCFKSVYCTLGEVLPVRTVKAT